MACNHLKQPRLRSQTHCVAKAEPLAEPQSLPLLCHFAFVCCRYASGCTFLSTGDTSARPRRMQARLLLGGMPVVGFAKPQSAMRGSSRGQKMSEFNCRHRRCFFFLSCDHEFSRRRAPPVDVLVLFSPCSADVIIMPIANLLFHRMHLQDKRSFISFVIGSGRN